jgi:hypothetical protein
MLDVYFSAAKIHFLCVTAESIDVHLKLQK